MASNRVYPDNGKTYPHFEQVSQSLNGGPGPSTYEPMDVTVEPGVTVHQQDKFQPQSQSASGDQQPPLTPYQQYPSVGQPTIMHHPQALHLLQRQPQVVVIGGPGLQQVPYQMVDSYVGAIVLSCFVFWFCNILFGLIAFILVMVANNSAVSDPVSARQMGRASIGVSIAGIFVTVVIITIVLGVTFGTARPYYNTCGGYMYYYNSFCYSYRTYMSSSYSCYSYNGHLYDSFTGYCYYN